MIDWDSLQEPWLVNRAIDLYKPEISRWLLSDWYPRLSFEFGTINVAAQRFVYLGPLKFTYVKQFVDPAVNRAVIRTGVHMDQRIISPLTIAQAREIWLSESGR